MVDIVSATPRCSGKKASLNPLAYVERKRIPTQTQFASGFKGWKILKSTESGFVGYNKDKYTTLKESTDRVFATEVAAHWNWASGLLHKKFDFSKALCSVFAGIKGPFAEKYSPSVQATIWYCGQEVIKRVPEIKDIKFVLPNIHYVPINSPVPTKYADSVLQPTSDPSGYIVATISNSKL